MLWSLRSLELWSEFWITKSWMLHCGPVSGLETSVGYVAIAIEDTGQSVWKLHVPHYLPKLPAGLIQNLNGVAVCHCEMGSCHQRSKQFWMKFNFGHHNHQCFALQVLQLPRALQPLSWSVLFLPRADFPSHLFHFSWQQQSSLHCSLCSLQFLPVICDLIEFPLLVSKRRNIGPRRRLQPHTVASTFKLAAERLHHSPPGSVSANHRDVNCEVCQRYRKITSAVNTKRSWRLLYVCVCIRYACMI